MQSNLRLQFLSVSLLLLPLICAGLGGWQPIKNLNDPHLLEIARFAVSEFNKQSKMNLTLDGILKGEKQIVSGVNYRLNLAVEDGSQRKLYEAIVWEKDGESFKKLISFKPIDD
ncbi:hypothetical protein SLEP1_g55790 [Rubroshorea leprosula]|uniref:Cystatin domain-containing protein n=1 Tax=Rubroshorea leprosula TaxID=152421 RepID=A0AAV5MJN8_9ROSI|nr:hypothetical protein SLEP1_g55790 [Rubroshorea leprosula]